MANEAVRYPVESNTKPLIAETMALADLTQVNTDVAAAIAAAELTANQQNLLADEGTIANITGGSLSDNTTVVVVDDFQPAAGAGLLEMTWNIRLKPATGSVGGTYELKATVFLDAANPPVVSDTNGLSLVDVSVSGDFKPRLDLSTAHHVKLNVTGVDATAITITGTRRYKLT